MKVLEMLRGCTPGRIQSVGYMQVIPLISDMVDDRFTSPEQGSKVTTTNYGSMVFKNETQKIMIVPSQAAYVTKQAAQDHALPHTGMVKKRSQKTFNTACCIQQSQGGMISDSPENKMSILPFPLREKAHKIREQQDYSKLWEDIKTMNRSVGISSDGNVAIFYKTFQKELDQFVAEFEPVEDQVGAIILINGKVVGVERTPNHDYWLSIWPALIRECYGSLAIIESKSGPVKVPKTRAELKEVDSIDDLISAVDEAEKEEYDSVKDVVANVSETEMKHDKIDSKEGSFNVSALSSKRFVGQIVKEDEKVLYASIISTDKWKTNEDWYNAKSFSM